MSYERRKPQISGPGARVLGSVVEYDPSRQPDENPLRLWLIVFLAGLAGVSFVLMRGCLSTDRNPCPAAPIAADPAARPPVEILPFPVFPLTAGAPAETPAEPVRKQTPEALAAARWLAAAVDRAPVDRVLLERLAVAERDGNVRLAIDALEKLRTHPSMADLDDAFARRLGALNLRLFLSGEPFSGVVNVSVRAGASVARTAREHGTTTAAVRRMNGLGHADRFAEARTIRILEFPRATLAVHRRTHIADLTLNGRFFRRYYTGPFGKAALSGAYAVTRAPGGGPRERFQALGIRFAPPDLSELDLFLAPGSTIAVSEM